MKIFKSHLIKPDGRDLFVYASHELSPHLKATSPLHREFRGNPHLRWHPLRGEWVAYATHRQNRTFLPPKEYNPLAPTRSENFPTELPQGDYDVAVFTNLFASLTLDASEAPELFVPAKPAIGHCEVVVFTQDPQTSLAQLSMDHLVTIFEVWKDRYREIAKHSNIRYILPFENRGVEVGVTLSHPHGQIYSYSFVPPLQQLMLQNQRDFYLKNKKTLLEDFNSQEEKSGSRIIVNSQHTLAYLPVCARYPYETWIVPKRPVQRLEDLNVEETRDLARTLKTMLLKFDRLWDKPFPYLMSLFAAPLDGEPHPEWHFHIQIYPPLRTRDKLKYLAGTELAAGLFVNDSLPEEKAQELQSVEVSFD